MTEGSRSQTVLGLDSDPERGKKKEKQRGDDIRELRPLRFCRDAETLQRLSKQHYGFKQVSGLYLLLFNT